MKKVVLFVDKIKMNFENCERKKEQMDKAFNFHLN